jgi:simple sugar transport system permease protein
MGVAESIVATIITASLPLLLAALGELVVERSGVLNLGVEGMMMIGAVAAFGVAYATGNGGLGVAASILAGMAMAALFAGVALGLAANQVAAGLALTLLGLGLAGPIGEGWVDRPGVKLPAVDLPVLSDLPLVGRLLFAQDALFYLAVVLTIGLAWFLFRTRAGLILRSVGDNPRSAYALGLPVLRIRLAAVLFGGACAGLAGAYLALVYTPIYNETMTGGRGWIALALVVFATWLPFRLAAGALLFGAASILQLHAQALGVGVPSQLLTAMPYLVTILVLVLISRNRVLLRSHTPASLGQPFVPER